MRLRHVAALAAGLLAFVGAGEGQAERLTVKEMNALLNGWEATGPVRIIDGDTLKLRGVTIRLYGIDAPEANQVCAFEGIPFGCGVAATLHLEELIAGRAVTCRGMGDDRYGRQLAVCAIGQMNVGGQLVRDGMAMAYREYSVSYAEEEDEAREARRGLWEGRFEPPWEWRRKRRGI